MAVERSVLGLAGGAVSLAESEGQEPGGARGPVFARASVFIDGVETGYERAGVGRPVVVLVSDPAARLELSVSLSAFNRVILPEIAVGAVEYGARGSDWVRGLLIGLGIETSSLVMDAGWSAAGLSLALAEPDRVDRLALVVDGATRSVPAGGIEDRLSGTGQRVLVIPTIDGGNLRDCASRIALFFDNTSCRG